MFLTFYFYLCAKKLHYSVFDIWFECSELLYPIQLSESRVVAELFHKWLLTSLVVIPSLTDILKAIIVRTAETDAHQPFYDASQS